MSQVSKKKSLSVFVPLLAGLFVSKALWVGVDYKFLPKEGVEKEHKSQIKPLYYRYTLASKKDVPKPVIKKRKPVIKKHKVKAKPKAKPLQIRKFKLKGIIYENPKQGIATIEYLGKSFVLAINEEIEGFKLVEFQPKAIIFERDGKTYKLDLFSEPKNKIKNTKKRVFNKTTKINNMPKKKEETPKQTEKEDIQQDGDVTVISKNLFDKYKKDIGAIRKNIGVSAYMEGDKLKGFKVRYIKKGSDFDRVGIKTGDIITAINGEELTDLSVPMKFFSNLDEITNATITIQRGNEEKELEYEVR